MELDLTGIVFRVSVMYLYALALLRISGKQSVSHLTTLDFIVTLIIGDLFDDVFWAEVSILQGMVGFAAIALVHILITFAASHDQTIHHLVCSPPRLVVENGRLLQENLRRERLRPETIQSELRLEGGEYLKDIREGWVEPKGKISVLKTSSCKPLQKKDKRLFR